MAAEAVAQPHQPQVVAAEAYPRAAGRPRGQNPDPNQLNHIAGVEGAAGGGGVVLAAQRLEDSSVGGCSVAGMDVGSLLDREIHRACQTRAGDRSRSRARSRAGEVRLDPTPVVNW